ncbi:MAG TPA: methyltransferase domain-containing protein [Croceibacterium sp.]
MFGPLEAAGIEVFHSDLKEGDGIDLAGDILDPAVVERLATMKFKAVLLSNLLEHVRDRDAVARACERIVGPGGHILVTVPRSYPYHPDPIDTLYRPSPEELARLFADSALTRSTVVEDRNFADDLRRQGLSPAKELRSLALRWLTFFRRTRGLLSRTHRWLWYRRPYQTSVALLTVKG